MKKAVVSKVISRRFWCAALPIIPIIWSKNELLGLGSYYAVAMTECRQSPRRRSPPLATGPIAAGSTVAMLAVGGDAIVLLQPTLPITGDLFFSC